MSIYKWGNLKSGKLEIVEDHISFERQKEKSLKGDPLMNGSESGYFQNNTSDINNENAYKDDSCSLNNKFYVPSEIKDIYKHLSPFNSKTSFVEYFFDSCSSSEESSENIEIKSLNLVNDSKLYTTLFQLRKKKTTAPWSRRFIGKKRNCIQNDELRLLNSSECDDNSSANKSSERKTGIYDNQIKHNTTYIEIQDKNCTDVSKLLNIDENFCNSGKINIENYHHKYQVGDESLDNSIITINEKLLKRDNIEQKSENSVNAINLVYNKPSGFKVINECTKFLDSYNKNHFSINPETNSLFKMSRIDEKDSESFEKSTQPNLNQSRVNSTKNNNCIHEISSDSEYDQEDRSNYSIKSKDTSKTNNNFSIALSSENEKNSSDEEIKSFYVNKNVTSLSKNSLLKSNETLCEVEPGLKLFSEDFLINKEIWLIQCPKNIDTQNLKGQSVNMSKRSVVFNNDRKYECHVHQNNTNRTVNLAFPTNKDKFHLSVLPLAGNIVFEEKIEVPEVTSIFIHSKSKIPLPDISRTRHPLLGSDFIYQPKTYTKESNTCGKKRKHKNYKPDNVECNFFSFEDIKKIKKKKK